MTRIEPASLTIEQVQDMVRRELSAPTRIGYMLMLLITLTGACLVATLWLTEPAPLPTRTHVAFAALVAINAVWSVLFSWVLIQRKVLFAAHRVIAGWMALVFCGGFLIAGLMISMMRGSVTGMIAVGLVGSAQIAVAILMLRRARRHRRQLLARREELIGKLAELGSVN
jgi:hypothetical protein